jgi:hypothetical protein
VIISYDLNYRDSLWKSIGGKKRAQEVNRRIAPFVDVMLGNEEDFSAALGYNVLGTDEHLSAIDPENFKKMITNVVQDFPFKVVATTLRNATTATRNDRVRSATPKGLFIRREIGKIWRFWTVGGGDSFASGLIYGFLAGKDPQWAVECGAKAARRLSNYYDRSGGVGRDSRVSEDDAGRFGWDGNGAERRSLTQMRRCGRPISGHAGIQRADCGRCARTGFIDYGGRTNTIGNHGGIRIWRGLREGFSVR